MNEQLDPQMMELQMRGILEKTTGIECKSCNGLFFEPAVILRRLSRLHTGRSQDDFIPVQAFRCMDCGEVCKEMFPNGLPDVEQKLGLKKLKLGE